MAVGFKDVERLCVFVPLCLKCIRDKNPTFIGKENQTMAKQTRREVLKGSLALAGLGILGIPEWALPAPAEGETLVPFTDIPANTNFTPAADRRNLDIRTIDGPFTPKDKFFTTQHYGHPEIDPAAFSLKISGLVERPMSLSLDDLKKM